MSNDLDEQRAHGGLAVLFLLIVGFMGWDLAIDQARGTGLQHLAAELLVLLVAMAGVGWQAKALFGARRELTTIKSDLSRTRDEVARWRADARELVKGLGVAIQQQFKRWELTTAEAEIGILLLKGLSFKEIANLRQTSERTVREQARTLYRKAGLAGRANLSAFFLEDLLLPAENKPALAGDSSLAAGSN